MAKTSQEIEQEFISSLKLTTGKDIKRWITEIKKSGKEKRNDAIKWLKEQHNFGHMHASLLMGIYANGGKPVYASSQVLLDNQFEKYPEMRSVYHELVNKITGLDSSIECVAKKTYISITGKREFAAINVRKGELRIGFDLGDYPFDSQVEKSKLTGPMPRISHMVIVRSVGDLNDKLVALLKKSNERVNP